MIHIVSYTPEYRADVLALSIKAWEPVFPPLLDEAPAFVCESFYPDGWRERQFRDLAEVLDKDSQNIDVALDDDTPVGWVCTKFPPEDDMGEVYVLAVHPDFQGQGIGRALMEVSFSRIRGAGMRMVMVETGDDSGHAPARAVYESAGFQRWPVARYFKDLDPSHN